MWTVVIVLGVVLVGVNLVLLSPVRRAGVATLVGSYRTNAKPCGEPQADVTAQPNERHYTRNSVEVCWVGSREFRRDLGEMTWHEWPSLKAACDDDHTAVLAALKVYEHEEAMARTRAKLARADEPQQVHRGRVW